MPLAPAIAAALTTHAARAWGLFVDGLDVSAEPATPKRYGVVWPSVDLHISAPGAASSIELDVDDEGRVLTFTEGQDLRLCKLDQVNQGGGLGSPWFLGTVEVATSTSLGTGRSWHLRATGVDAIPDWTVTDYALAWTTVELASTMVQAIVAACSNRGPLNATVDPVAAQGSVANPIGHLGAAANLGAAGAIPVSIPAGTSMRRAVELVIAACSVFDLTLGARFTVDMYGGVRLYEVLAPVVAPDGDPTLGPLTALGAADLAAEGDVYTRDGTTVVRQVVVNGAGGVRGIASDGSGRRGRSAVVTDNNLTTAAAAQAAAQAYLASHTTSVRGQVSQTDIAGGAEAAWVLYKLGLTDDALGSTGTYEVGGMAVTFDAGGRPSIRYTYGGRAPTLGDLVRRMAGQPLQS